MNDEHRLDGLKFIAQATRSGFSENLQRSFRLTYSTITFFTIVIAAPFSEHANESITKTLVARPSFLYVLWMVFTVIALIAALAIFFMNRSATFLRRMAERSENEIIDFVNSEVILPKSSRHSNPNDHAHWYRIAAVVLFSVIACFVYTMLAQNPH